MDFIWMDSFQFKLTVAIVMNLVQGDYRSNNQHSQKQVNLVSYKQIPSSAFYFYTWTFTKTKDSQSVLHHFLTNLLHSNHTSFLLLAIKRHQVLFHPTTYFPFSVFSWLLAVASQWSTMHPHTAQFQYPDWIKPLQLKLKNIFHLD